MRPGTLLLAVVFCVLPVAGRCDTLPDSQTLRDRSDAAYGALPDNYREVIDFEGPSASGKRSLYRRGPDRREIRDTGPIHTEFGSYKGDHWHENANGHVVIDQTDPGLASREVLTTTVSRVSTPVDAYVISTLNSKGFGTRAFIDPVTYYEVRQERLEPNGRTTTSYSDFRAFGTRHLATHWSVHDETTATDTQYDVREYVAGGTADLDVEMPVNKRLLVEYPAGQNRVALPATFLPDGHILVRLTIGGRGYDLFLDTGASGITIDPSVAASLGLTVINKMQSSVNAGRFATGEAIVPAIGIGPLALHDTVVSIAPLGWEVPGAKVVGLLGFDFICESGITIDYDHQTVIAERFGTYSAPTDPRTIPLDIRLGSQQPYVSATIDGDVAERILIDTGGAGPFLLFDYFARRHPDAVKHQSAVSGQIHLTGAGGGFDSKGIVIDDFSLGNVSFKQFSGFVVTSASSYAGDEDGLIGPTFLRFFDLHLDYPNGRIYLVPNATGRSAMH